MSERGVISRGSGHHNYAVSNAALFIVLSHIHTQSQIPVMLCVFLLYIVALDQC